MSKTTGHDDGGGLGGIDSAGNGTVDANRFLSRYRKARRPSPVVIKNCVATAFFGTRLDLEEISWRKQGEFNPRSFAAAKLRLRSPSSTALVFASGKIVCTGSGSEAAAHVAVMTYYKMVSEVAPRAVLLDMRIENIVGTGYVGHALDLRAAYEWLKGYGCVKTMYSPELFPGMRFEIRSIAARVAPNVDARDVRKVDTKVLAFQEGNVVICGAKTRDELSVTWKVVRSFFSEFEADDEALKKLAEERVEGKRKRRHR
ncbi:MAG: hypothetical protein CMI16_06650 [Opitutaceae bacterium]|nr:hypothetical protein [Opitutaceae bacterium]